MIHKPLDQVTPVDIHGLIQNEVMESRNIEYKLDLPGTSDGERREFLADVSSFANAGGGDLIYGVQAVSGVPKTAPGLASFNEDQVRLRLESSIRDGIEPRIPGVHLRAVDGFDNGPVLLLRVPCSWTAPHMVTFKGASRFFARSSAGKFQMDVDEIRIAFEGAADFPQRIRRWRDERLGRIVSDETPVSLRSDDRLVVHFAPMASFSLASPPSVEVDKLKNNCEPTSSAQGYKRYNLDGVLSFRGTPKATGYSQLYRDGRIETVRSGIVIKREGVLCIPAGFETIVVEIVAAGLDTLRALDIPTPVIIMITLLGVGGCKLWTDSLFWRDFDHAIDRDLLILREIVFEGGAPDVPLLLRPAFDAVWNAAGHERSRNYKDGQWQLLPLELSG